MRTEGGPGVADVYRAPVRRLGVWAGLAERLGCGRRARERLRMRVLCPRALARSAQDSGNGARFHAVKLLLNADCYAPTHLGVRHLLIAGERIVWMGEEPPALPPSLGAEVHDVGGRRAIPGSSTATSTSRAAGAKADSRAGCRRSRCSRLHTRRDDHRHRAARHRRRDPADGGPGRPGARAHGRGDHRVLPHRRVPPPPHHAHRAACGTTSSTSIPSWASGRWRSATTGLRSRRWRSCFGSPPRRGWRECSPGRRARASPPGGWRARGLDLVRRALAESELPPATFHPTHVNRSTAPLRGGPRPRPRRAASIDVTAFPTVGGRGRALRQRRRCRPTGRPRCLREDSR